jgi:hypothetical protein
VNKAPTLKLYWCETLDHHEDWFVVARRDSNARRVFAREEGYDEDDVSAAPVLALPEALQDEGHLGWPTRELLEACGAQVLRWETPRVVELAGARFVEGMLEHQILQVTDDLFELKGQGRPNKTDRDWPS